MDWLAFVMVYERLLVVELPLQLVAVTGIVYDPTRAPAGIVKTPAAVIEKPPVVGPVTEPTEKLEGELVNVAVVVLDDEELYADVLDDQDVKAGTAVATEPVITKSSTRIPAPLDVPEYPMVIVIVPFASEKALLVPALKDAE